jgi:hypothetical protein
MGGGSPPGEGLLVLGRTGTETIYIYVQGDIKAKDSTIRITPGTKVILYHHNGEISAKGKKIAAVFDTQGHPENFQVYAYNSTSNIELDSGNIAPSGAMLYAPETNVVMKKETTFEGGIFAGIWEAEKDVVLDQKIDDSGVLKFEVPAKNRIRPSSSWQERPSS